MSGLVTAYKCDDDTDFPVEWENPEDAELSWVWGRDHFPLPTTPLDATIGRLGPSGS